MSAIERNARLENIRRVGIRWDWVKGAASSALTIAVVVGVLVCGRIAWGQVYAVPGESVQGYLWPVRQARVIAYPPGSSVLICHDSLSWIAPRLFPPQVFVFVPDTSITPMAHSPVQKPVNVAPVQPGGQPQ